MDYARREFLLTFRRVLGAFLGLSLLVAFWADRPLAAASVPKPETGAILAGDDTTKAEADQSGGLSPISYVRRPWLAFYTVMGAPALNQGALSDEEEGQFRRVVFCLAGGFFVVAGFLWFRGQRYINEARKAT
jgi:hypothetical protein